MLLENSGVIYTNKAKCRDCNRCVRACPIKAIRVEDGQAQVIPEKCIACGTCVRVCPQNAKTYRKDTDKLKQFILNGDKLIVSIAPSFAGIYSEWERSRLPSALRQIGFSHVAETAVGAYYTAQYSKEIIQNAPGKSHLLTACPAFVSYIEKYQPQIVKNLVQIDSPMVIHAKMLRKKFGRRSKIVFIGPCVAKKDEAARDEYRNLIDAVLTFEELDEIFALQKIDFAQCEESDFDETPGLSARNFPLEGGLLQTANFDTDMMSAKTIAVSGYDEISEIADLLQKNDENYIIEPLFCNNGCINGPGISRKNLKIESRKNIIEYTQKHKAEPINLDYPIDKFKADFKRSLTYHEKTYTESEISETLAKFGKFTHDDELNCNACGYDTCRDKAIAVLNGFAEYEMCMPYMRRLAETKTNMVIDSSPNGIIVLNENLEIESINPTFKKMFSCSDAILKKRVSYLIDPDIFEKIAAGTVDEIRKVIHYPNYNLICHQISYALRAENKYIGIFVDITDNQINKDKISHIKKETVTQAQELIEHQINMTQELVRFLGENTAKGEMLMNNLIDAIRKE